MSLTSNEIQHYREEGYLILPSLVQGEKLAQYMSILGELVDRAKSMPSSQDEFVMQPDMAGEPIPGRLAKVQGVCVVEPRVLELAGEPEIVDRVTSLIGPQLHMFGSKFFPMLPHGGTSTSWHQDNHYFGTNSHRVVSCGIYLEGSIQNSGAERGLVGVSRL